MCLCQRYCTLCAGRDDAGCCACEQASKLGPLKFITNPSILSEHQYILFPGTAINLQDTDGMRRPPAGNRGRRCLHPIRALEHILMMKKGKGGGGGQCSPISVLELKFGFSSLCFYLYIKHYYYRHDGVPKLKFNCIVCPLRRENIEGGVGCCV